MPAGESGENAGKISNGRPRIVEIAFRECRYNPQVRNVLPSLANGPLDKLLMRAMRLQMLCCLVWGILHSHGSAFAQDSPLVPPWGRNLPQAESVSAPINQDPAADYATAAGHAVVAKRLGEKR